MHGELNAAMLDKFSFDSIEQGGSYEAKVQQRKVEFHFLMEAFAMLLWRLRQIQI